MMSKKTSKSKAAKVTKPSKAAEPAAVVQQAVVLVDADNNDDGAKLLITPTEQVSEQRTNDAPVTPEPTPAEADASAPAEKPKKAAAPKDRRNGITRPGEGKCLAVWPALDAVKADAEEQTFEALRLAVDSKIADATIRTQRQRWRQYNAEKNDGQ